MRRSPSVGALPATEILAPHPASACNSLHFRSGIEGNQSLGSDLFFATARVCSRAHTRDARGRFATGHSGNPRGRPPGIPNPPRRVPDLIARPLSAQALSDLLDRKPHMLRPFTAQLLPPPLASIDPAVRLGIDLSSVHTVEHCRQVLTTVLAAIARGEIAPAEG